MENPIKIDDLGVPLFSDTPTYFPYLFPPCFAEAVHLFNPSTCSYIICDSAPALGYPIRHASQGFQDLLLGKVSAKYFGGEIGSSNLIVIIQVLFIWCYIVSKLSSFTPFTCKRKLRYVLTTITTMSRQADKRPNDTGERTGGCCLLRLPNCVQPWSSNSPKRVYSPVF